jgi:hypothetical protein
MNGFDRAPFPRDETEHIRRSGQYYPDRLLPGSTVFWNPPAILAFIREHYQAGVTIRAIVKRLNAAGWRQRRGELWDRESVYRLLQALPPKMAEAIPKR